MPVCAGQRFGVVAMRAAATSRLPTAIHVRCQSYHNSNGPPNRRNFSPPREACHAVGIRQFSCACSKPRSTIPLKV